MRFFDYHRASELMQEQGIDLLLAHTITNCAYLSDHLCPWVSNTLMLEDGHTFYATFIGVARDSSTAPFIITTLGEEGHVLHSGTWIKDVRYWGASFFVEGREKQTALASDPIEAVAQAVESRGLEVGCLGVEMEHLPVTVFNQLQARLPRATFANAWPVFWRLRAIKHPEEIRRMRIAAQASEKAIQTAFDATRVGMSELEIESLLAQVVAREGCRYEWSSVAFGPKGAVMIGATQNKLKPGDIIRIDLMASYRGRLSDMSRNAVFGSPSRRLVDAHAAVLKTNNLVKSAMRPGITGDELYRMGLEFMRSHGYHLLTQQVGHGVGCNSNEPPFLSKGMRDCLRPNMILTVEIPLRLLDVGSINVEDMLLVTEDGVEPLTTLVGELQRLG